MVEGGGRVPERVAAAIGRGATVLLGSQRGVQALRRDLALASGTDRVWTWTAWTSGLWHRALLTGATDRLLLNRTQEEAIWRAGIAGEPGVSALRSPRDLAGLAAAAWGEVAQYRGLGRLAGSATHGDAEVFLRLAAGFEEHCRRHGYLPVARLEAALRRAILAKALVPEGTELVVWGFDRLSPARRALLEAVREVGVAVEMLGERAGAGAELHVAADEASELRGAAAACRGFLEEHAGARVAILVPGLGEDQAGAAQIDRVLREVLAPEAEAIGAAVGLPYEIVCGRALGESPSVVDALDMLAWAGGPLGIERVGSLLVSASFGGLGEEAARAEFDAFELRRSAVLRPEVTLDWLVSKMARSARRDGLARLLAGLRGVQTVVRRRFGAQERRTWGEWAEAVRELLAAAGWAGAAAVDAAEFEVRRGWESALDELATLDFENGRVGFGEALETLRGIAAETMVSGPRRDAAVQVMAPGESAGMRFDAVWFVRAGDLSWPGRVAGSPLLGWPLRRELGLPGSDAAADQAQARRVTERIAGCAGRVVFSYARETAEGRQRRSGVLGVMREEAMSTAEQTGAGIALEAVADEARIPVPPDRVIPGGAAVLKAQAACGFRAFAERRLFATELEPREPGMNARERGNAVHGVLERFWATVETQAALRGMSRVEREARLGECIDGALGRAVAEAATPWDAAYLATERRRLLRLGQRWLTLEAGRAVAFTVARRESEARDVAIGPLHLTLRVDRVDRTEHGAVLIDYKTGKAEAADWLGERPGEPQLPLYAVLAGEKLHDVAFGKVRAGEKMEFTGYEELKGLLKKRGEPTVSLEVQVEAWKGVLTRLATDFWRGDTRVSPKQFPATCKYCAQRPLCRLDTASLMDGDEDDEEAEDRG